MLKTRLMTRKQKKLAKHPKASSGNRKMESKSDGIPGKKKTQEHVKSKAKTNGTKDLELKNDEFEVRNKVVQGLKQKGCELKIVENENPMNVGDEDDEDDTDDLDEFDEETGDPSEEEQQLGNQKTKEEDSDDDLSDEFNGKNDSDDSGDESESFELGNVPCNNTKLTGHSTSKTKSSKVTNEKLKVATGENLAGKSRQELLGIDTDNTELGNDPLDNTKLMVASVNKNATGKAPNEEDEDIAGGNVAGKSRQRNPTFETLNGELEKILYNAVKLMEPSVSKNVAVKRTNELVKMLAGKNGGKVNANVRFGDSDDLRTCSELEDNPHSTTKLLKSSNDKNDGSKAAVELPKFLVGKNGGQNLETVKIGNKKTTSAAGTHQRSTGKMIQGSISRATASINKNVIPRIPDDHANAVSILGSDEDAIEEGCDVDSSDDETTILEVFDAIGSKNEQKAQNSGDIGSKLLPKTVKPNSEVGAAAGSAWAGIGARKSFAQLFKERNVEKKGYKLEYIDPEGDIVIEDEDVEGTIEAWGHALVGYIAGKNPSYKAVIGYCKSWTHKCRVHFDASGWIVVKFEKEDDLKRVLEGGPYLIYGKPFIVKAMPKYFCYDKSEICKAQVWVNLPHLPLELWTEKSLSKIGSGIGEPIQVDSITASKERASFARLLVEVDVSKKLIDEIAIVLPNKRRIIQEVRYEYIPTYCETCQAIGHDTKMCASRRKQAEDQRSRIGAKAVSHKPYAASSELASLKVSTNPTFDASTSKSSKAQNMEKICEESEDGFVEYLSKNRKKALAKGKKQVGFGGSLDIEEISAGINKAAGRWQRIAEPRVVEDTSIVDVLEGNSGVEETVGALKPRVAESKVVKGTRIAEPRVVEDTSIVASRTTRTSLSHRDQKKGGNLPRSFR